MHQLTLPPALAVGSVKIFGILLFWFTYAIMPVGNGINTCIFNENPRESHSLGFSIP